MQSVCVQVEGRVRGKITSKTLWRENKKNAMQSEVGTDDMCGLVEGWQVCKQTCVDIVMVVALQSHGAVIKALEEDPDVFDYDGQYDKMQEQKRKSDPRLLKKDKNVSFMASQTRTSQTDCLNQDFPNQRT